MKKISLSFKVIFPADSIFADIYFAVTTNLNIFKADIFTILKQITLLFYETKSSYRC